MADAMPDKDGEPTNARVASALYAAAWLLVGGGFAFAVLAMMTIGVFVLPVVVAALVLLVRRPRSHAGLVALPAGLSLPTFYVAWLNRDGPGVVCRSIQGGSECVQEWSPWPWLAVGLGLLATSVVWTLARRSRGRSVARGRYPI
jgi:hypothetical protein